ncbi:acyl-CoA dehydrogenase domain-containing protein [Burkholderia lata]|uniref:acyl-CoA dehydrogenase family protein n=1 Tax=Burkholderia lata (strain ATCC 17760 / DSM 23089 / LMG 22485 / NCIMB 9086 / R18194 / 383) TaxID=482957 RepID=UPI0014537D67|nr:acyl-CoA dehydrogenase family protein [Burkholderia lata]VWC37259.1 acyl-CoA dehydrogenase domain-containing protein [Burkholderia lata]
MTITASEAQHTTTATFRDIAERHAQSAPSGSFHRDAWDALSEAGLWRLPVPRELGGAGGTWRDFIDAFETIAATLRSVGFAMALANQATLIRAIVAYGSDAQRARHLPPLLSGAIGATAISEKGTGTEVRALETGLVRDGDHYRLDGHKYNISHAPEARLMMIVATLTGDGKPATALVLIDPERAGVQRSAPQATLGVTDLPIGDIALSGVRVEADELLGAPGDGLRLLMDIASMNRALFGLLCANVTQPFLADALAHTGARKTLGVALDSHQHVQRRLVDVQVGIERTRWTARAALDLLVEQRPEALANCSIAKLAGARDLAQAALHLLAIHGSDGYRHGPLATFVADALAMGSAGGTEEMHYRNIFSQMQRRAAATARAA